MNWLRIRELVRKEFIQLFRDKKNRPLLFVAPFIMLLVFGYVVSTDVKDIRVAVFDQSHSKESRMLLEKLNANKTFRITRYTVHHGELEEALLNQEVDIAIRIGPDFSRLIRKGDSAPVQILADGTMSNMSAVRISYTSRAISLFNNDMIEELYAKDVSYGKINARIRTWFNPNLESQHFYVPGMVAVLVMILSLILTSMAVIREKESGTIEQLIVTPLKPIELILGKTIPYIIIAQAQMVAVTIFAILWFDVPFRGNAVLIFIGTGLFLLSTLGIGLFISTISTTQQQAMMTCFFFILPFFMFSGFIFPISNMPLVIQWLSYLNPLMYFLIIIRGIFLKGIGLSVLWPQFLSLTILGLVVFTGAVTRFKKRLD